MSSAPFPERIDAVKMFARVGSITADLPLARLQRFSDQLSGDAHTRAVAVDLQFGTDEEGRRLLSGTLDAQVPVACQRCLQHMELALHCDLSLLVFDTEEELEQLPGSGIGGGPEGREGVVMTEDGLDVVALIEDELLLSLPMIPMHDDPSCNGVLNELKESGEEARPNPFAVLAALKTARPEKARSSKSPGKGSDRSPDRGSDKSPDKSLDKSPDKKS